MTSFLVDLVGPCKLNWGTMEDHMVTIDMNGGPEGRYIRNFLLRVCSYRKKAECCKHPYFLIKGSTT